MINLCKSNKQLPTPCHIIMVIRFWQKNLWSQKDTYVKQSHKNWYTVFAHKFCPISFVIFLLSLASVCHAGLTCKPSQIFRLPNNLWRRLEILSRKEQKTKFWVTLICETRHISFTISTSSVFWFSFLFHTFQILHQLVETRFGSHATRPVDIRTRVYFWTCVNISTDSVH